MTRWFLTFVFVVIFLFASLVGPENTCNASAKSGMAEVHILTDKIVDRELDLLKLNTEFRIATDHQTKSRTARQFLYNLLASGVSLGATTTIMAHRWSDRTPDREELEAGAIGLVIGQAIINGGIFVEYSIDKLKEKVCRERGLDPKTVRGKVQKLKIEIDKLLLARKKSIKTSSNYSKQQLKILQAESEVLDGVRDLALIEFARFYSEQHKRRTSRNVSYLNGLVAVGTGGYGGSLVGLLAVTGSNPKLAVPAGIGFIISSATVMASPVTNRLFSMWSKKRTSKEIREALGELSTETVDILSADLNTLSVAVNATPINDRIQHINDRLAVYVAELDMLTHQLNRENDKKERGKTLFKDRLISNNIIGASKMTWGTMLIYAGSKQYNQPRRFNRTIAEAATVYTVGQSAWVGDTLISGRRPKALKFSIGGQLRLPVEKLEKRFERLEKIEDLVNHAKE